jgi:hypothetical protein
VAEHAGGGSRAQQFHVVDAVPTCDHGVHQRQQLAARVGPTRPVTKIDHLVGDLLDPQPLGQGCGQQQSGAGDRTLVVEGDVDLVQDHVRGWPRKGVLRLGIVTAWQPSFSLVRGPFHHQPITTASPTRWIQAQATVAATHSSVVGLRPDGQIARESEQPLSVGG